MSSGGLCEFLNLSATGQCHCHCLKGMEGAALSCSLNSVVVAQFTETTKQRTYSRTFVASPKTPNYECEYI